jgi:Ca2+-transporting ATPase
VFEGEAEEADIMDRPPRGVDEPIFSRRMISVSVVQGAVVLLAVLGVYLWAVLSDFGANDVRALAFTALVAGNLALIFVNRSWTHTILGGFMTKNKALWWVTGGTVGMLALLFALPGARDLFQFEVLQPLHMLIAIAAGVASVMWFEVYKVVQRKRHARVA